MEERIQMTEKEIEHYNRGMFLSHCQMTDKEKREYLKKLYDLQKCDAK